MLLENESTLDLDLDMDRIKSTLEEKGYVVIPNILNDNEIIEYIDEFNKWMNSIDNLDEIHSLVDFHGIFKHHQVGHQRFAWLLRTNPKILNVFKSLWNTDELVVSFDGCCYYSSDYYDDPRYWIHSDQSPLKKGLQCIQSFVSLTSNRERTFIVYEGSHKLHEDYTKTYNLDNPSDWNPIKKEYADSINFCKKTLEVETGSMVLWDSRTFHQNTCGYPSCNEERLVQYLCYLPKNHPLNDEDMHQKRIQCFNDLRTTNHYPYPITCVPEQPNVYNYYNNDNIYIDYKVQEKPILDDLMEEIEKLL